MVFNLENCKSISGSGKNEIYEFICPKCSDLFLVKKDNCYARKTDLCTKCSSLIGLSKVNTKDPFIRIYNKLITSSKHKEQEMSLSFEDFIEFTKIDKCTYCDCNINWLLNRNSYNLDRKDNNIGYIKNNLTVCCWNCNNTKSNRFTHEEFLLFKPILIKIMNGRKTN